MEQKRISPLKAIRLKCLDCCCGSSNEVKRCTATGCALYPFREGHNPFIARREYTDEQKAVLTAHLNQIRPSMDGAKFANSPSEG